MGLLLLVTCTRGQPGAPLEIFGGLGGTLTNPISLGAVVPRTHPTQLDEILSAQIGRLIALEQICPVRSRETA